MGRTVDVEVTARLPLTSSLHVDCIFSLAILTAPDYLLIRIVLTSIIPLISIVSKLHRQCKSFSGLPLPPAFSQ